MVSNLQAGDKYFEVDWLVGPCRQVTTHHVTSQGQPSGSEAQDVLLSEADIANL